VIEWHDKSKISMRSFGKFVLIPYGILGEEVRILSYEESTCPRFYHSIS
jgi:hypothetical protein